MTTPATDGKMFVNALYHSAVVSGLAAAYARLGKIWGSPPKLDFTPRDVGMVVVDVVLAMATKDILIINRGSFQLISWSNGKHSNARWGRHGERPGVLGVELPGLHVEKL